jgi:indole-3-glycerol phosphate synthase
LPVENFLHRILESKRREVAAAKAVVPLPTLRERALRPRNKRLFFQAMKTPAHGGVNIIAEIKRASPSAGPILPNLDPASRAAAYEAGGARALSVLTDKPYFHGTPADLRAARAATKIPVLRKDFMISTYQLYEAAVMGADAVLLIVRILSTAELEKLLDVCRELALDALVEVNTEEELDRATQTGARLIGINNRDLSTFQTDTARAVRIASCLRSGQVAVAASGIKCRDDIEQCLKAGIHNFLIGEFLSRAEDPRSALQRLLQGAAADTGKVSSREGGSHHES